MSPQREPSPPATRRPIILQRRQVLERAGLSNSTVWRLQQRGDFPKPVQLSPGRVGWHERDVDNWVQSRRPRGDT